MICAKCKYGVQVHRAPDAELKSWAALASSIYTLKVYL